MNFTSSKLPFLLVSWASIVLSPCQALSKKPLLLYPSGTFTQAPRSRLPWTDLRGLKENMPQTNATYSRHLRVKRYRFKAIELILNFYKKNETLPFSWLKKSQKHANKLKIIFDVFFPTFTPGFPHQGRLPYTFPQAFCLFKKSGTRLIKLQLSPSSLSSPGTAAPLDLFPEKIPLHFLKHLKVCESKLLNKESPSGLRVKSSKIFSYFQKSIYKLETTFKLALKPQRASTAENLPESLTPFSLTSLETLILHIPVEIPEYRTYIYHDPKPFSRLFQETPRLHYLTLHFPDSRSFLSTLLIESMGTPFSDVLPSTLKFFVLKFDLCYCDPFLQRNFQNISVKWSLGLSFKDFSTSQSQRLKSYDLTSSGLGIKYSFFTLNLIELH